MRFVSAVAFTICFAICMMFAVIGIPYKISLGLDEMPFDVLAATSVLTFFAGPPVARHAYR